MIKYEYLMKKRTEKCCLGKLKSNIKKSKTTKITKAHNKETKTSNKNKSNQILIQNIINTIIAAYKY